MKKRVSRQETFEFELHRYLYAVAFFYENQIFQSIDLKKIGLFQKKKENSVINFEFDVICTPFFLNCQKLILRNFFEFDEKSVPLT